jgi:hypothetical protein
MRRVVRIHGDGVGSAFILDRSEMDPDSTAAGKPDTQQYLVTAHHLVGSLRVVEDPVSVLHAGGRTRYPYDPVPGIPDGLDIAVIRIPRVLEDADKHPVRVGDDVGIGDDCFIFGYPRGLKTIGPSPTPAVSAHFPIVQKGVIGGGKALTSHYQRFVLGIPPTRGFSGGPVVIMFREDNVLSARFFGVVQGGVTQESDDGATWPAGLTLVIDIRAAVDAVKQNP